MIIYFHSFRRWWWTIIMRARTKLPRFNGADWYQISGRARSAVEEERQSGGSRAKARTARVWSINHVVPGDRWTLGSMETPHNWENSAGLLVDQAHGHLSCRDRAPIDGSARFELTPVKSHVARLGKSASFDLSLEAVYAGAMIDTTPPFWRYAAPPCTS